jgi:hypothetical protein
VVGYLLSDEYKTLGTDTKIKWFGVENERMDILRRSQEFFVVANDLAGLITAIFDEQGEKTAFLLIPRGRFVRCNCVIHLGCRIVF